MENYYMTVSVVITYSYDTSIEKPLDVIPFKVTSKVMGTSSYPYNNYQL